MNGPFKAGEFSLHDNEYDSARIEFTISCHKIVTSKTLFYPDEGRQESPFVDTNQIINEEIRSAPVNNNFNNNIYYHSCACTYDKLYSRINKYDWNDGTFKSPHISPQLPPIPNGIGDSTNIPQQIQNIANTRQIVKPRPADSSQLRNIINNNNMANSIPVPPKHPRRQATVEEETDSEHIRVNNSPPSSERMINVHHYENDAT
ncbi:unnamed protein product [Rhizophagus irregularis]|nr:unnamed protein product [Rhizophagus irregularis]